MMSCCIHTAIIYPIDLISRRTMKRNTMTQEEDKPHTHKLHQSQVDAWLSMKVVQLPRLKPSRYPMDVILGHTGFTRKLDQIREIAKLFHRADPSPRKQIMLPLSKLIMTKEFAEFRAGLTKRLSIKKAIPNADIAFMYWHLYNTSPEELTEFPEDIFRSLADQYINHPEDDLDEYSSDNDEESESSSSDNQSSPNESESEEDKDKTEDDIKEADPKGKNGTSVVSF